MIRQVAVQLASTVGTDAYHAGNVLQFKCNVVVAARGKNKLQHRRARENWEEKLHYWVKLEVVN